MTMPKTLLEMAGAPKLPLTWAASALVLVDHQQEYTIGKLPLVGIDAAVAELTRLIQAARAAGAPVVHVRHQGRAGGVFDLDAPGGQYIPGLEALPGEAVVSKGLPNGFANTNLKDVLTASGRKEIIVGGFATHMCISATVRSAVDNGFRVGLVANACATRDLPDPLGGIQTAQQVHRATLAALNDRFATVVAEASAIQ
ncbi:cysteine hydrolase family protein [Ferrovibrio sp.]|uniref:cysteine hydrolase family protein n=1 Tax=Ferrovibrio sp. TaxID=1917215 RepID=UPI001B6CA641|nr:cysteine hydrolase family protein [Ferrovibrio sp.]MBP7064215.1 cysteine hydrolase [Ferrovibrio sp.]